MQPKKRPWPADSTLDRAGPSSGVEAPRSPLRRPFRSLALAGCRDALVDGAELRAGKAVRAVRRSGACLAAEPGAGRGARVRGRRVRARPTSNDAQRARRTVRVRHARGAERAGAVAGVGPRAAVRCCGRWRRRGVTRRRCGGRRIREDVAVVPALVPTHGVTAPGVAPVVADGPAAPDDLVTIAVVSVARPLRRAARSDEDTGRGDHEGERATRPAERVRSGMEHPLFLRPPGVEFKSWRIRAAAGAPHCRARPPGARGSR